MSPAAKSAVAYNESKDIGRGVHNTKLLGTIDENFLTFLEDK